MSSNLPHILLVEEDEVLAQVTAFRLELLGYSVQSVGSGEAALAAVMEQRPHLMIVDLTLPNMSGQELIERIGTDEQNKDIAIMAVSIEADLDAVQLAYNAGATDYLVAPFDPLTLESKVESMLALVGKSL